MAEYRNQCRGGEKKKKKKITEKVGYVVGAGLSNDSFHVVLTTNKGQVIRMKCSDISIVGRNTQGVKLINLKDGEFVTGMALLEEDEDK